MIDFQHYQSLVDKAQEIDSKGKWVAKYGYPDDCQYEFDELNIIYEVAHGDVKSLVARIGQMTAFSDIFRFPYRTVQDWRAGRYKIQNYTIRMLGYILIVETNNKDRIC